MRQPGTNAFAPPANVSPIQGPEMGASLRQPVNALVPQVSQDTLTPSDRSAVPGQAPAPVNKPVSLVDYARGNVQSTPNLPPMRSANYMVPGNTFGLPGENLVDVNAGGKSFQVHKVAAPAFKGLIDDLHAAGAPLGSIGGYSPRPAGIAGTGKLSQHAMGNAMDLFSQRDRDKISKDGRAWIEANPDKWNAILQKWNMRDGGTFGGRLGPDLGHVEWMGPRMLAGSE
jgi:hypothetical protein